MGILFQLHGSIWLQVLPYCLANVAFMLVLYGLDRQFQSINFSKVVGESSLTHTFGGLIVSFLLVTRINSALARYFECRQQISIMFQQTRGIIQKAIVFSQGEERIDGNCNCCQYEYKNIGTKQRGTESAHHDDGDIKNDGTDDDSKENHNIHKASNKNSKNADAVWRTEITYRTLLLLRATATNVEFPSQQIPAYRIKELTGFEKEFVQPNYTFMKQHSIPQATALNSFRVPLKLEQLLRSTISSQTRRLSQPMSANHQIHLQTCVDQFMGGLYGIRKFMTTPIPFPLVQMAHTMGLVYVYTLPFVFLKTQDNLYVSCFNIFLLTYGFYGLMLVSIVLDDPFGNDPNDFDVSAYARFAMDDALIMLYDVDGNDWANTLHRKMGQDVGVVVPSSSERSTKNKNISAPPAIDCCGSDENSIHCLKNNNACCATGTAEESALLPQTVRMTNNSATVPDWLITSERESKQFKSTPVYHYTVSP